MGTADPLAPGAARADGTTGLRGRILRIQRLSTEDGPGLRSTAFLKGCGLACAWCHNPESLAFGPEVQWLGVGCLACGTCAAACPEDAVSLGSGGVAVDRGRCSGCGACAAECPSGAMEMLGREWEPADLIGEMEKDRSYFEASGGGITLSGGEAALQPGFVSEVLRLAKGRGLSTALDTCGHVPWASLEQLLGLTDLVLYDLKILDPDAHRRFTGADNRRILENVLRLAARMKECRERSGSGGRANAAGGPAALWIRTPVIPGATDDERNIRDIGTFIAEDLGGAVERWELCAFNNLCADKYTRLGREWSYEGAGLVDRETMERLAETARPAAGEGVSVVWTGAVKE